MTSKRWITGTLKSKKVKSQGTLKLGGCSTLPLEKAMIFLLGFFNRSVNTVSLYKKIVAEWLYGGRNGRNIIYRMQEYNTANPNAISTAE